MKINKETATVELETKGSLGQSAGKEAWDNMINSLPGHECRYVVYDLHFEEKDGRKRDRMIFVTWFGPNAFVMERMLYARSKEGVVEKLGGIFFQLHATDLNEAEHAWVTSQAFNK